MVYLVPVISTGLLYLKMDIEGAEPEALLGATRLINSFAPYLAISIYHSQFVGNN